MAAEKEKIKLTPKQERFCKEYVIDLNATQAAIRAGYSEKTAKEQGCQALTKLNIQQRIKQLQKKSEEKLEVTHEEILMRLKTWAESDITETIGLTPEQVKELPLHIRQLVTKYKHTVRWVKGMNDEPEKEEIIELHFVSKEKALEMINRHTGFYEADNNQKKAEIDYTKLSQDVIQGILGATGD